MILNKKIFSPARFIDSNKEKALFFSTLRKRVDSYFRDNNLSKHYNTEMVIKSIVMLSLYIGSFVLVVTLQPSFGIAMILWAIMGFSKAGIGMSVMHDANHGAYSSSSKVNLWMGHTLNLVGGSVFNWKIQHNILHHTYTNIVHLDDDVEDKGMMRFSPHTKIKWFQNLQFVYAFLFYGILTIYWAVLKDFIQFNKYKNNGTNKNSKQQNKTVLLKIIISKIAYGFVFFVLPIFILKAPASQLIIGFLLMHFIAGILLTLVFQLAHAVEESSHPLPNDDGNIENNWAVHQLNTTVNFARSSKFISWYVGGLNYQVEHHLFPSICHVHYPEISKIVELTTKEFGIPYLQNKTFLDAVRSHIKSLKRFGRLPAINEAIA